MFHLRCSTPFSDATPSVHVNGRRIDDRSDELDSRGDDVNEGVDIRGLNEWNRETLHH